MPQVKSAVKCVKTTTIVNKRNATKLSKSRTAVRKLNETVGDDTEDVLDLEAKVAHVLGRAISRGLISRNKVSRGKSRLLKKAVNK